MKEDEIRKYLALLSTPWQVNDARQISQDFSFKDFRDALAFINRVGEIAETENHHPDIYSHNWNKVRIDIMTHKIKGLTESDFILAAKIENTVSSF